MVVYQRHNSGGSHNYNAFFYENCDWYPHFHKNFELAYVLEGSVELTQNATPVLLEQGSFALTPPHVIHSYHTPHTSRVWIAVFSADFVPDFAKQLEQKTAKPQGFSCEPTVLDFLMQHLITDARQDVLMLKSALYAVCSAFLHHVQLMERISDNGFSQQAIAYVSQHFQSDISLQSLADRFGYEYHYASRQFHQQFHMNFKQFLNMFRTEFAREQLLQTDLSVTQIALISGFQNSRTFNRVFLEQTGMTPSHFRSCQSLNTPVSYTQTPLP